MTMHLLCTQNLKAAIAKISSSEFEGSKYFLPVLSVAWSFIGKAKLNSFPFQGFKNMQVGGIIHFDWKQLKKPHQYNNEF